MDDNKITGITLWASKRGGYRLWTAWTHRGEKDYTRQYNDITQASLERLQRAQKRIVTEQLTQAENV